MFSVREFINAMTHGKTTDAKIKWIKWINRYIQDLKTSQTSQMSDRNRDAARAIIVLNEVKSNNKEWK